jgi:hypothetical protein
MEDYIFILIAILLSIFGAINRKKKQDQTAVDDDAVASSRSSVFDQLFEDPLFADKKPQVKPQVFEQTAGETYKPPVRKTAPVIVQPVLVRKPPIAAKIPDQPPKRRTHPLMKGFSLKKAVVYAEILNRKY